MQENNDSDSEDVYPIVKQMQIIEEKIEKYKNYQIDENRKLLRRIVELESTIALISCAISLKGVV